MTPSRPLNVKFRDWKESQLLAQKERRQAAATRPWRRQHFRGLGVSRTYGVYFLRWRRDFSRASAPSDSPLAT